MRRRKSWLLVWIVALALIVVSVTACEGGTSGSVISSRQSCSHRGDSGSCKGSYRKLSGTYSEDIENDRIFYGDGIQVKAEISVESGMVRVSVESPDGTVSSVEVGSGKVGTLEGMAKGLSEEFVVRLQAVDGEAAGVTYEIIYEIP